MYHSKLLIGNTLCMLTSALFFSALAEVALGGWHILYCCYKKPIQFSGSYIFNGKDSWVSNKMMVFCFAYPKRYDANGGSMHRGKAGTLNSNIWVV